MGFVVGDVHYALDIGRVLEVVHPLDTTSLPHMPDEVVGVADHRGEVVPIVDLRIRFGLPSLQRRSNRWILVRAAFGAVGLLVDAVTDVFDRGGELRPVPDVGGDRDLRGIAGAVTHEGRLTFVLDPACFAEAAAGFAASDALPASRP